MKNAFYLSLAAFAAAVVTPLAQAREIPLWPKISDTGYVTYARDAIASNDSLLLFFSDNINAVHLGGQAPKLQEQTPVEGCFSVAQLALKSGMKNSFKPGVITFSCTDVPAGAEIFMWTKGKWRMIPSWKDEQGRMNSEFNEMTTYAILVPSNPALCYNRPLLNDLDLNSRLPEVF